MNLSGKENHTTNSQVKRLTPPPPGQVGLVFGLGVQAYTLALGRGCYDYLERLPDPLLLRVLAHLQLEEVGALGQTSHRFRKVSPHNTHHPHTHTHTHTPALLLVLSVVSGGRDSDSDFICHIRTVGSMPTKHKKDRHENSNRRETIHSRCQGVIAGSDKKNNKMDLLNRIYISAVAHEVLVSAI